MLVSKLFITKVTLEILDASVMKHMSSEVHLRRETFPAGRTIMVIDPTMLVLMPKPAVVAVKNFIAEGAGQPI